MWGRAVALAFGGIPTGPSALVPAGFLGASPRGVIGDDPSTPSPPPCMRVHVRVAFRLSRHVRSYSCVVLYRYVAFMSLEYCFRVVCGVSFAVSVFVAAQVPNYEVVLWLFVVSILAQIPVGDFLAGAVVPRMGFAS